MTGKEWAEHMDIPFEWKIVVAEAYEAGRRDMKYRIIDFIRNGKGGNQ